MELKPTLVSEITVYSVSKGEINMNYLTDFLKDPSAFFDSIMDWYHGSEELYTYQEFVYGFLADCGLSDWKIVKDKWAEYSKELNWELLNENTFLMESQV